MSGTSSPSRGSARRSLEERQPRRHGGTEGHRGDPSHGARGRQGARPTHQNALERVRVLVRVALEVGVPVVILDLLIDSRLVLLMFMAAFLPALINPRLARGLTGEAPRDHRPNVYPREAKIGFLVGIATLGLVIAYVALAR